MRNLQNIYESTLDLFSTEVPDLPLIAKTWSRGSDANANGSLLCVFGPSEDSAVIDLKRLELIPPSGSDGNSSWQSCDIASWDAPCPRPDMACDQVLNLHYFEDRKTACLIMAGGDIVVVSEEPLGGQDKIEIVGSVDAGITTAAWSPDEDMLSISTCADTFLLMTRDFEILKEYTFSADDLRASKHVSVGWGKAETQFKGKRAKILHDPTMPQKVDEGHLSPLDKGMATISWRGDGAFVAISTVESEKRRIIRVFSRDGILDSVSEPTDALEGTLSWRPTGNLIAGIQRLEDRIDVVFFERNGLRHGQFSLRLTPEEQKTWGSDIALHWNADSSVLAVCFEDRVQLWTMGNYHYYLKQEIHLPNAKGGPKRSALSWHPESPLRLALSVGNTVHILEYVLSCAGPLSSPPCDFGVVAVIDGCTLKLTPLRLTNIPPPMALHEVSLESGVVASSISQTSSRIAVLRRGEIDIFEWDLKAKPILPPSRICKILFHELGLARQICFVGDADLFCLTSGLSGTHISGYKIDLSTKTFSRKINYSTTFGVAQIFPMSDHTKLCIQTYDGKTWQTDISGDSLELTIISKSGSNQPGQCMTLAQVQSIQYQGEVASFYLTDRGDLCANGETLVKGSCTSFLITPAHLIFTTTQHLLKFVHLAETEKWSDRISEALEIPPDNPETDERCRTIERGARLVSAMPSSFSLVLQMPRGNLEMIFPRALVLAGIRRSLSLKDYKTAFLACRSHRVNMNILHDHAPEQFMSSVGIFVDQIRKVEHIDLFLSQLKEEDVSRTMYRETLKASEVNEKASFARDLRDNWDLTTPKLPKVNRICNAFLDVLQGRTSTNLQNIITAHVCKLPPDLEAGLLVIAKLQDDGHTAAEKAVEHICFLADVNKLYDHALGLYDLDLALLVAQQSQMDPREYLPFLQKHQEMSQGHRMFSIDNHLGRFAKALKHLHELGAFEELKDYMLKNELYKDALDLYRYQPERLNEIIRLYANYLSIRSNFREAGIAFEYLSLHREAMDAYRAAGLWGEALFCAAQASISPAQIQELTTALAESLYEAKDFANAARIHLDHRQDVESAARTFCKGYLFADAMRVVVLHGKTHLLESVIDQGLADALASSTELLADCKRQILAQVPRLRELRAKKEEDPVAFYEGVTETDAPDNVSLAPTDTSTSASLFTRYTGRTGTINTQTTRRTSKNKRREERKRARGKKGSVYEEEYLVNSIGRLIDRVNSIRDEVERLVQGLVRRKMRERALAIESALNDVVELIRGSVEEVYGVDERASGTVEDTLEAKATGANGVLQECLEQTAKPKEAPVIKALERLSLLGL